MRTNTPLCKINVMKNKNLIYSGSIKTFKNVFGISIPTAKKPSKMFSADPFRRLKNLQKCFRQIHSDSRKTCRKRSFSHDQAGSHSKRWAGCQSKRWAGSHSERSFVRPFVCSLVGWFVRSFLCSFVCSFVPSFIELILHVDVVFQRLHQDLSR